MTGYLDQYGSDYDFDKDESWSMGSPPIQKGFTNFWGGQTSFWGFEDYETKHKRKIIEKTASIFEDLTGNRIHINMNGEKTNISSDGSDYNLDVNPNDAEDEIKTKTRVERALSHILANSPIAEMNIIANRETMSLRKQYNYQTEAIISSFKTIFDSLEDRRSQFIYGEQYTGAGIRFNEARKVEGKEFEGIPEDPITALKMSEKGRNDLVEKSKFKAVIPYVQKADRTTEKGVAKLTRDCYKKVVEPWLKDLLEKMDKFQQQQNQCTQKQNENNKAQQRARDEQAQESSTEPSDSEEQDKSKPPSKALEELENEGIELSNKSQKLYDETNKIGTELNKGFAQHTYENDHTNFTQSDKKKQNLDGMDLDKVDLSKEEKEAEGQLEEMEKALDGLAEADDGGSGFTPERHYNNVTFAKNIPMESSYKFIDQQSARKLSRIFKKIQASTKMMLSDEGTEIDTEALIDAKIKGYGDFMRDDETTVGFDIVISVDESGSMGGNRMHAVKKLTATMMKALEEIPSVHVQVIGWTGGMTIRHINKLNEVDNLHATGGTPFAGAIAYSTKYVLGLKSRRKLFFMVTDAEIDDYEVDVAQKALAHMKKHKVKCVGIYIGHENIPPMLGEVFGDDRCIGFRDVTKFKDFVVYDVARMVQRYLKGGS